MAVAAVFAAGGEIHDIKSSPTPMAPAAATAAAMLFFEESSVVQTPIGANPYLARAELFC